MTLRTTTTRGNDKESILANGLRQLARSLDLLRRVPLAAVLGLVASGRPALFAGTYTDSQNVRYATTLGTPNTAVVDGSTGVSGAITSCVRQVLQKEDRWYAAG